MSPQKVPLWHVDYLELEDNWASKVSGGAFYSSELHSDSVMHICVCVCVFFRFFFLLGYYKILSTVLCAIQYVLVGYFSVYMLIPTS